MTLVLGCLAKNMRGVLIGILAFTLVRLKLLPNIFFTPRKLRVAVFANAEWGSYLHEPKLPLALEIGHRPAAA
jgi:hypothetical protein